jgi:hypothetical protein
MIPEPLLMGLALAQGLAQGIRRLERVVRRPQRLGRHLTFLLKRLEPGVQWPNWY